MAGLLCSLLRGFGLVVANPLLVLVVSSEAEFARNCWPLIMERATPVAANEEMEIRKDKSFGNREINH